MNIIYEIAAVSAAALTAPAFVSAATPRKELHVAAIGVNGMGWSDLSQIGTHASVKFVGFCDIDKARFDKADAQYPGVPHFADYRELFSSLADKVDAALCQHRTTCRLRSRWKPCGWENTCTAKSR